MYDIGIGARVEINADCARMLIAPATDIENLLAFARVSLFGLCLRLSHKQQSAVSSQSSVVRSLQRTTGN
jgi:hypothetical protein